MCKFLCSDGIIFDNTNGYSTMFRCPCPLGEKFTKPWYWPHDKDRKQPIYLALYGAKKPHNDGRGKAAGKE